MAKFYCHVCEEVYEDASAFFSSPLLRQVGNRAYPVRACRRNGEHRPEEIRAAYRRMTGTGIAGEKRHGV